MNGRDGRPAVRIDARGTSCCRCARRRSSSARLRPRAAAEKWTRPPSTSKSRLQQPAARPLTVRVVDDAAAHHNMGGLYNTECRSGLLALHRQTPLFCRGLDRFRSRIPGAPRARAHAGNSEGARRCRVQQAVTSRLLFPRRLRPSRPSSVLSGLRCQRGRIIWTTSISPLARAAPAPPTRRASVTVQHGAAGNRHDPVQRAPPSAGPRECQHLLPVELYRSARAATSRPTRF